MNRCFGILILLCGHVAFADNPVELEEGQQLLIRQILPTDCRVVRGLTHSPIDGREDTRYNNHAIGEWSSSGGGTPAVNYRRFNGNNGLHVTLPEGGFDAMQVRGDWRGRVYLDSNSLTKPDTTPFCRIPLSAPIGRTHAHRVSFFYEEGALSGGEFSILYLPGPHNGIYRIPYSAIRPRKDECTNLLVPVCASASHIAMTSVRMGPVWMILGESAGVAASLALKQKTTVQAVDDGALSKRLRELNQRLDLPTA